MNKGYLAKVVFLSVIALQLLTLGSGCTSTYSTNSLSRTVVLRTNATALVAMPEDGHFGQEKYPGSGQTTAFVIGAAFAKHLRGVDVAPATATRAEFLEQSRAGHFDYLIVPTVLHWEDRATEWSGMPDRIEIEIRTLDTQSGDTLALGAVTGKSKWATLGGDKPEDLLEAPIKAYVAWLFAPLGKPLPLPREETRNAAPLSPKSSRR